MYTIADLERLTLEISISHRMDVIAVLMGPEQAAELEEKSARRPPGELISDTEVPLSLIVRQAAERSVAKDSDDLETLRILAGSRFVKVREDVAGNPNSPPEVLVALARRNEGFIAYNATKNASFPVEELGTVGVLGDMSARWGALLHPRVPQWLVDRHATDPHPWLRARAAHNPALNAPLLLALADDPEGVVRGAAAQNLNLPHEVLHRLATCDPNEWTRASVAENPAVPEVTLLALAGDEAHCVRAAAAKSLNLTPLIAGLLVNDPLDYVQRNLAANQVCPSEVLTMLARRGRDRSVRYQVAANPSCPPDVRRRLREKDRSLCVRQAAERLPA